MKKLKIIHTNDLHSYFDQFAKASTLIKEHIDEETLLLDAGDFADFRSIELRGTRGLAAIELLEYLGYDALTIGNNEMFDGAETLEFMAQNSSFPFISNNLFKKDGTPFNGVVPSKILIKNGLRILITGSSPDMGEFSEGLGVHFTPYKEGIAREIERHQGTYDLCVVLNHVGTIADEDLARSIDGIDVIISSHDHQLFSEAKIVNGTIINSAGCYGNHIGLIELKVNRDKIELVRSATISTESSKSDAGVISILHKNKERAIEALSRPLYNLEHPLWHDVIEENRITNLIADGLKDMLGCELGLINSGIVNAGFFDYISNKKLIEICPSPLNPTSFEIKGMDIKSAIEQSLDAQVCLSDGKGPGFRGKFVGRLHVSGATVVHDGKEIIAMFIGEEPIQDDKWYTVASSDYIQRGSGYESLANNRNAKYRAEEIRDVIREYAKDPMFLENAKRPRWTERTKVIN
ncbi:bifunctional UDP-sugar hydrolase/5'-nucleotidase [Bacillus sp. Marseille-Q3570]|uniref:bifunctional metallophosphatase/5'-nucleotidase n=1 Tax=Bacillus sp. Marseille-Q3570 TaxID=2963522 RepID=UPI0021B7D8F6|nr:5'-nucleotidase C-terminal domain-containing protein [Bacillus sp. Marseille-Q3570]